MNIVWNFVDGMKIEVGGKTFIINEVRPPKAILPEIKMIEVPGGKFFRGSNHGDRNERPVREIEISKFEIGKYPVTQKLWVAVMGNNPSHFKGDENLPVEMVSWDDTQEFLKKLNFMTGLEYRLPTEAEWEYACKGAGKQRSYGVNKLESVAWLRSNSGGKTHPVGMKEPNDLQIYDLLGNVGEWCSDFYDGNYYENSTDKNPHGPETGFYRVLRGGSWFLDPDDARSAYRSNNVPGYRDINLGFRLARTLP